MSPLFFRRPAVRLALYLALLFFATAWAVHRIEGQRFCRDGRVRVGDRCVDPRALQEFHHETQ